MRSGAEDPHLVDVELVEDGDVPPPASSAAPSRGRGRAWAAVAALAVASLVSVALAQVEERRHDAHIAALAGLPGFLDPLDGPLDEVWRSDAGRPVARTATRLILSGASRSLTAVDVATGTMVWQRAEPGEACTVVTEGAVPALPDAVAVVCWPRGGAAEEETATATLTVVDPPTGAEVRALELAGDTDLEVVGALVVATSVGADGAVTVRGWDPVQGTDAWSVTATSDGVLAHASDGWRSEVSGQAVTFTSADARLTFDPVTGLRRAGPVRPSLVETLDLPGGREVRWGRDRFGRPRDVVVVDRHAGTRVAAPGLPWVPGVSDGVVHDVVVVRRTLDQHLVGLDAGTGQVRWDLANVAWLEPAVQVGPTVLALSPASATALDVGTGLRLWTQDVARGAAAWRALTDGRVVLLPTDDDDGVALVARGLQTGEETWRVPLPGPVVAVDEVDGRTVLVLTADGLVALR